jgi:hypothetical protein
MAMMNGQRARGRGRRSILVALLALAFSGPVAAQEAYGRVWLNQNGEVVLAAGARVEIRCPSGEADAQWSSGEVGDNGTYRMGVPATGRCDVRVVFRDQASTIAAIFFTREPTRANFELLPSKEGWTLRRR